MDRRKNPYAPGAGIQPPELAGRDRLIEEAVIDMDRVLARRPTKSLVMLGLRGVGKTVLLNRLYAKAAEKGFETAKLEAPEGGHLPQMLAPELRRILYALDLIQNAGHKARTAITVLRNFVSAFELSIGDIGIGVKPAPGRADTGNLEQDLPDLLTAVAEAAAENGKGVAIFIDEVQYLSGKELASVVVACHEIAQRGLPLYFIGAGLPQVAALAGNAKSYAERLFDYPEIGALEREAAIDALVKPARETGVEYTPEAVDEILHLTAGYPYFIQEWGSHAWNEAPESPVSLDDVNRATPQVIEHLDASFFRVRFDRLTPLQQKYLRAMAELGPGPHNTGDISAALGVKANAVATVRQQLIDKGMIWSQRHGETAFTVPLFDQYMKRQMPQLIPHQPKRRNPGKA